MFYFALAGAKLFATLILSGKAKLAPAIHAKLCLMAITSFPVAHSTTRGVLACKRNVLCIVFILAIQHKTPRLSLDSLPVLAIIQYICVVGACQFTNTYNRVMKVERITSGEHAGWWCASQWGIGVYSGIREVAIRQLRLILGL